MKIGITIVPRPFRLQTMFTIAMLSTTYLASCTSASIALPSGNQERVAVTRCIEDNQVISAVAAILSEQSGQKFAMSDAAPSPPYEVVVDKAGRSDTAPIDASSQYWNVGWTGQHPNPEMVKAWRQNETSAASKCWTSSNSNSNIEVTSSEEAQKRMNLDTNQGFALLAASAPVYDRSRKMALVFTSISCPGLCGNAQFTILKKVGADWKKVGGKTLYIS